MARKNPFVSVVVPYRNARQNVIECVQSLLSQNYPKDRYEIIMVDNGSTDGGNQLLEKCKGGLVLLKEGKRGSYAARNTGIKAAKGEIIAFTDSDCVADRLWLNHIANSFKEKVVAVAGEIYAYKPKTNVEFFYGKLLSQKRFLSEESPYAATANFSVRKSLFARLGFFDECLLSGGDTDFCFRLQDAGYSIKYAPLALLYHKNVKTRWQFFKKIFFQSFYAPNVIKKNIQFLERRRKLPRIGAGHYRDIIIYVIQYVFSLGRSSKQKDLPLKITFLCARKLGLMCGSIRFGFFYI